MKNSNKTLLKSLLVAGAMFSTGAITVNASSMVNFKNLGEGAEIRSNLASNSNAKTSIEMNCGEKEGAVAPAKEGDTKATEMKCGEGKCGDMKKADAKAGDAKATDSKATDMKCGEGKCGDMKKAAPSDSKAADMKCGEGKCGDAKPAGKASDANE